MKYRFESFLAVLVILSLVLVATGCVVSTPQPAPAPEEKAEATEEKAEAAEEEAQAVEEAAEMGEPYKIGAVLSITGGASTLGAPQRNTLEMVQEALNAAGGIQGPDGLMHPVEVIIYDTESDETKTVLAAKKLIEEDQVSVILGASTSGETLAILDTVQKAEVPIISLALSIKIVEPAAERRWSYKTTLNDSIVAEAAVEYLKGQGITKVAWLSSNNGYGDSGLVEFKAMALKGGLDIVAIEKHEVGDTDMTAQLTKIRGTDAEALINWSTLPEGAIIAKNAYDLGLELPIVQTGAANNPKFIESAGPKAAQGIRLFTSKQLVADQLPDTDPQKKLISKYREDYRAAFGDESVEFGGFSYDAFNMAVQAMEKAGPDRAAIRDELEKVQNFVGVSGIYTMSPKDHKGMTLDSVVTVEIADGEYKLLNP
jgi:branched-chain amino acid transport system substrate-binding protein